MGCLPFGAALLPGSGQGQLETASPVGVQPTVVLAAHGFALPAWFPSAVSILNATASLWTCLWRLCPGLKSDITPPAPPPENRARLLGVGKKAGDASFCHSHTSAQERCDS